MIFLNYETEKLDEIVRYITFCININMQKWLTGRPNTFLLIK